VRLLAAATRDTRPAREAAYFSGSEAAIDQQLIWAEDPRATVADLLEWVPPRLPITGGAIVARGIDKGPEVARLLGVIERRWIDEGFPGGDRIERIADEVVAQT
jgi:poly(A) polymerase